MEISLKHDYNISMAIFKCSNYKVYLIANMEGCNCGECERICVNHTLKVRDLEGNIIKRISGGSKVRLLNRRTPDLDFRKGKLETVTANFVEDTLLKYYNLKLE